MPQPISAILDHLSTLHAKGQRLEQTLREIRDIKKPQLEREYEGAPGEARTLVEWFIRAVIAELKPGQRMGRRVQALRIIEQELRNIEQRGFFKTAFPQIDPARFYIQAAYRVIEPKWIDQADASMCDIAAYAIQMARIEPVQYVTLLRDLYKNGRSVLGDVGVNPNRFLRYGRTIRGLAECDYVVLTSLRNSGPHFCNDPLSVRGISSVARCSWLRGIYLHVENHAITKDQTNTELACYYPEGATPEKILRMMGKRFHDGYNIQLLGDRRICDFLRDGIPISAPMLDDRHAAYLSDYRADSTHVRECKVYTWCGAYKGRNIPISTFIIPFLGFVAYRDRRCPMPGTRL